MTETPVTMYSSEYEEPFIHDSPYDAIEELANSIYPEKLTTECYIKEAQFVKKPPSHWCSIHMVYYFLESLEECMNDDLGEDSDYRFDFTKEQLTDLQSSICYMIDKFTERKDDPYVYVKGSEKEIPVTDEDIQELYQDE